MVSAGIAAGVLNIGYKQTTNADEKKAQQASRQSSGEQ